MDKIWEKEAWTPEEHVTQDSDERTGRYGAFMERGTIRCEREAHFLN